jgi:dihydrofolate synthase / folylpolyglutamate synthase
VLTYNETIQYLYNQLPVFHRIGAKAFKADLSNTLALCEHLDNPHNKFKSIHVAGTNGKGSTSHFLAAILQSAGYKTGLYTSPHLKDFTERFKINGKTIEKQQIGAFVEQNKPFLEKLKPSFFEMSVALAFDFFRNEAVDIAVIEVGLGGRLDSTNVITPILAVITNIGYDHTDILGDTLPKIAAEKAGIIKKNVPVVISERNIETENVFISKAKEESTEIYFASDYFEAVFKGYSENCMLFSILQLFDNQVVIDELLSELAGKYQLKNIVGVFKSIEILRELGYKISEENIRKGFAEVIKLTGLKGRWQVLNKKPLTICDTGHNEHGIKELLKQIDTLCETLPEVNKKYFILGFVKDKDVKSVLELFPKDAFYYFCQADSPRAMAAEDLMQLGNSIGLHGESILNVNDAIKLTTENVNSNDLIFICGSTYLVAEIKVL